jgi:isovaleryl-CoA dehydrogenase
MTEPEAGSDVGSLTTEAKRVNGFVLNGQKVFCSSGNISDHILVVARSTKGEDKHEGLTMLFVARDNPGIETQPIETMGGRETAYVYLTDCEVSDDAVLGKVDQAWMQLMAGLNTERLILAATILGFASGRSTMRSPT